MLPQTPNKSFLSRRSAAERLWDLWCIASVVGIWPRFIEPQCIAVTRKTIKIDRWPQELQGLKLLHFSDLHLHKDTSQQFLRRLTDKIQALNPDLIAFTGDFLCRANIGDKSRLQNFLNTLSAPLGCYAVLGNHDYAEPTTINSQGEYDLLSQDGRPYIVQGFERLFTPLKLAKTVTARALAVPPHSDLCELLNGTPFKLMHNETQQISAAGKAFNLCGLGEYTLGRTLPQQAFEQYDHNLPGVILLHNPDGLSLMDGFPGELVLCGHTHGGQINLPWLWRKFTAMENEQLKRGLVRHQKRWVYVNRGIGSLIPFRWFSMPELTLLTMESA